MLTVLGLQCEGRRVTSVKGIRQRRPLGHRAR
jgi:hypothetical protein